MAKICVIDTTVGLPMGKVYGDATSAREAIESHLNPDLNKCGQLPQCRGCAIVNGVEVRALAERVAPKLARSNGSRLTG